MWPLRMPKTLPSPTGDFVFCGRVIASVVGLGELGGQSRPARARLVCWNLRVPLASWPPECCPISGRKEQVRGGKGQDRLDGRPASLTSPVQGGVPWCSWALPFPPDLTPGGCPLAFTRVRPTRGVQSPGITGSARPPGHPPLPPSLTGSTSAHQGCHLAWCQQPASRLPAASSFCTTSSHSPSPGQRWLSGDKGHIRQ